MSIYSPRNLNINVPFPPKIQIPPLCFTLMTRLDIYWIWCPLLSTLTRRIDRTLSRFLLKLEKNCDLVIGVKTHSAGLHYHNKASIFWYKLGLAWLVPTFVASLPIQYGTPNFVLLYKLNFAKVWQASFASLWFNRNWC